MSRWSEAVDLLDEVRRAEVKQSRADFFTKLDQLRMWTLREFDLIRDYNLQVAGDALTNCVLLLHDGSRRWTADELQYVKHELTTVCVRLVIGYD